MGDPSGSRPDGAAAPRGAVCQQHQQQLPPAPEMIHPASSEDPRPLWPPLNSRRAASPVQTQPCPTLICQAGGGIRPGQLPRASRFGTPLASPRSLPSLATGWCGNRWLHPQPLPQPPPSLCSCELKGTAHGCLDGLSHLPRLELPVLSSIDKAS